MAGTAVNARIRAVTDSRDRISGAKNSSRALARSLFLRFSRGGRGRGKDEVKLHARSRTVSFLTLMARRGSAETLFGRDQPAQ